MLTKTSLFVRVAFGAAGIAGISYLCHLWRKSKTRSALLLEKEYLKVRKVYAGTFGYVCKSDKSTSLESVLEYIKAKNNTCKLLRENANLIPTLAIDKYLEMNTGNERQADILEEEVDNLLDKEPWGKSNTIQNTLTPFSAVKDEEENFKNKPRDYDIDAIVQKALSNVLNVDELEVDLEKQQQILSTPPNMSYVEQYTRPRYKSERSSRFKRNFNNLFPRK